MSWTSIVGAGSSMLGGITESIMGMLNEQEASEREKALGAAPEYTIPESVDKFINYQRMLSQQTTPGYGEQMEAVEEDYATGMGSLSQLGDDPASILEAMGGLSSRRSMDLTRLGQQATRQQIAADMGYSQSVLSKAPYEVKQYEYNEWLPWQIEKNQIAAIRGMGQAQLVSGIDQLGAAGVMGMSMYNPPPQQAPQQTYQPYNYGQGGQSMNQMGQQQVYPATDLGSNPYPDTGVPQTGWTEDWMTQPFW